MSPEFRDRLQQEYITSLVVEFVKRANNMTLDTTNYTEESMDTIIYIRNVLVAYQSGHGPLI